MGDFGSFYKSLFSLKMGKIIKSVQKMFDLEDFFVLILLF